MLDKICHSQILEMNKNGRSMRSIARELNLSRNTVRKYLRNPEETPCYNLVKKRVSRLENYKDYLKERIENERPKRVPASVLFNEIQNMGYTGKLSILRAYIRQFKIQTKSNLQ